MTTAPNGPNPPTIVNERAGRRNVVFAAGMALLLFAIISPMLREDPLDTGTQVALGALVVVALGTAGLWAYLARNPRCLVVTDDEIHLEPPIGTAAARSITRPSGGLRLAKEGSVTSKTLILSSLNGGGRIPLHFMDRQEIVDACYAHGWAFGEPGERELGESITR